MLHLLQIQILIGGPSAESLLNIFSKYNQILKI
jgi:hypothetical protein